MDGSFPFVRQSRSSCDGQVRGGHEPGTKDDQMVVKVLGSSWQTNGMESSVLWTVTSSDAPYSVVALLWTTDGIPRGFFGASLGDILFEKRAAENEIEALNGEVTA